MKSGFTRRIDSGPRFALIAACALALAACAGQSTRPVADRAPESAREAPEDQVKARAMERWTLLIERRFEEAYELLSPGYRQTMSKEAYIKTMDERPVEWTRALFQKATCKPETCSVEIQVDAQLKIPMMRVDTVNTLAFVAESWLLIEGEWYMVPQVQK